MGDAASVQLPTNMNNGVEPENASEVASNEPKLLDIPAPEEFKPAASTANLTTEPLPIRDVPQDEKLQSTSSTPISTKAVASTSTSTKTNKSVARSAIPAVPVVPAIPKTSHKETKSLSSSEATQLETPPTPAKTEETTQSGTETTPAESEAQPTPAQPTKVAPKLWSGLFQRSAPATTLSADPKSGSNVTPQGAAATGTPNASNGLPGPGNFAKSNASSLAEALRSYQVSNDHKISFLEPRGLINTGNMCYMNSVCP
jgi:ubiquitin carboxyl-terminal hydrolase 10